MRHRFRGADVWQVRFCLSMDILYDHDKDLFQMCGNIGESALVWQRLFKDSCPENNADLFHNDWVR
jgi:hypothetical protein